MGRKSNKQVDNSTYELILVTIEGEELSLEFGDIEDVMEVLDQPLIQVSRSKDQVRFVPMHAIIDVIIKRKYLSLVKTGQEGEVCQFKKN